MSSQNNINPVDHIEDYVVLIDVDDRTQTGTGFFIGKGWVLTCAHVVLLDEGTGQKASDIKVIPKGSNSNTPIPATIEHITDFPFPDLALLKVDINDNQFLKFGEDPIPSQASEKNFALNGFPEGDNALTPSSLEFEGKKFLYWDQENNLAIEDTDDNNNEIFLLQFKGAIVSKGMSGGPILEKSSGKLCGMIKDNRSDDFPLGGLSIPVSIILEELMKVNIPGLDLRREQVAALEQYEEDKTAPDDKGNWYIKCNRQDQYDDFLENYTINNNKPQIYFISGVSDDCHESLIERFRVKLKGKPVPINLGHEVWEEAPHYPDGVISKTLEKFELHEPQEDQEDQTTAINAGKIFKYSELTSNDSIIFLYTDIYLGDFPESKKAACKKLNGFIEQYLNFWDVDIPENKKNFKVFIFFNLVLSDEEKATGFFGTIKNFLSKKNNSDWLINQLKAKYQDRQNYIYLKNMEAVEWGELNKLFNKKKIKDHNSFDELNNLFPKTEKSWRMRQIEKEIKNWINKYKDQ